MPSTRASQILNTKKCRRCKVTKPLADFQKEGKEFLSCAPCREKQAAGSRRSRANTALRLASQAQANRDDEDQELQQGGFDEIDMDVEFGEEVQEEMQEEVQEEVREEANIEVQAEDGSDITKSALERTMAIVNNTPNQSLAFRCGIVLEQLRLGLHMHGNKGLNSQEAAWIINHLAKSELQIDAYHHVYKPCKLEDKRVNDFVREFRSIYERIRDQVVSENPNALAMRFRNVVPDLRALPELKVHPKYRGIPPAEPHCSLWFNFLSL